MYDSIKFRCYTILLSLNLGQSRSRNVWYPSCVECAWLYSTYLTVLFGIVICTRTHTHTGVHTLWYSNLHTHARTYRCTEIHTETHTHRHFFFSNATHKLFRTIGSYHLIVIAVVVVVVKTQHELCVFACPVSILVADKIHLSSIRQNASRTLPR